MRKELSFIVALLLISIVDVQAQTDYTSKIINPSFEKGNKIRIFAASSY